MKNIINNFAIAIGLFATVACGASVRHNDSNADHGVMDPSEYPSNPIVNNNGDDDSTNAGRGGSTSAAAGEGGSFSDHVDDNGGSGDEPAATGGMGGTDIGSAGDGSIDNMAGAAGDTSLGGSGGSGGGTPCPNCPGGPPDCWPSMPIKILSYQSGNTVPGAKGWLAMRLTVSAPCEDLEVRALDFTISAPEYSDDSIVPFWHGDPDAYPTNVGQSGDSASWNFGNIKMIDEATGSTVMGPTTPAVYTSNDRAHLHFRDSFLVKWHETRTLDVVLDVSSAFATDAVQTDYRVLFTGADVGIPNAPDSSYWYDVEKADDVPNPLPTFIVSTASVTARLADDTPKSAIVVGGTLQHFTRYTIQNHDSTSRKIASFSFGLANDGGDWADFTNVQASFHGLPEESMTFGCPCSTDILYTFVDDGHRPEIPAGSTIQLDLDGTLADVVASSTVSGAWHGVPRSGHTPNLQLKKLVMDDGSEAVIADHVAPFMVLRKSKPVFTNLAVSSNSLTSGADMELYKFQVTPDAAGSVALKSFTFLTDAKNATVTNLRLFKGSTQLSDGEVIQSSTLHHGGLGGCYDPDCALATTFTFAMEEVISGSGTVYTVRGVPTFSEDAFVSMWIRGAPGRVETGALGTLGDMYDAGSAPAILWSDLSEVPHSPKLELDGGSIDWTSGYLLEGNWNASFISN